MPSLIFNGNRIAARREGHILVLCPFTETRTTRENALRRNRLVAEWCNTLWIPAARKGGSLESVKQEFKDKLIQGENR